RDRPRARLLRAPRRPRRAASLSPRRGVAARSQRARAPLASPAALEDLGKTPPPKASHRDRAAAAREGSTSMKGLHSTASRLVAAVALLAAPLSFGTSADKLYRNPNFKFSLYVFNDWNEVPVATGEDVEVAKFYEPGSKGDVFRPELTIFRVNRKG